MLFLDPRGKEYEVADEHIDVAKQKGLEPAWEMIDKTGKEMIVRNSHYQKAREMGLTPKAEAETKKAAEDKYMTTLRSETNPITSVIAGLASNIPGANFIPGFKDVAEASWQENPVSYGAGKTTGLVGSAFVPGGGLAANVGMGALEGASQDEENRLRGAVTGGTLGGVLHEAGSLVGKAAGKLATKAESVAANQAFGSLEFSPAKKARFLDSGESQDIGRTALSEDMLGWTKGGSSAKGKEALGRTYEPIQEMKYLSTSDVTYSDLQNGIKQKAAPLLKNESTYKLGQAMNAYADDLEQFKQIHPDVDIANLDKGFTLWAKENNVKLGKLQAAGDIKTGIQETISSKNKPIQEEISGMEDYITDIDRNKFNREQNIDYARGNVEERIAGNKDLQAQIPKGVEPNLKAIESEVNTYINALNKEKNPDTQRIIYKKLMELQKEKEKALHEYNRAMKIAYNRPQMFENIQEKLGGIESGIKYGQKTKGELEEAIKPLQANIGEGKDIISKLGTEKESILDRIAKQSGKTKAQVQDYLETRQGLTKKASETTGAFKKGEKILPLEQVQATKSGLQKAYEFSGLTPKASGQVQREISGVYKNAVSDSIGKSLGKEAQQTFDSLNKNWGIVKTITDQQKVNLGKKGLLEQRDSIPAAISIALRTKELIAAKGFNKAAHFLEVASKDKSIMIRLIQSYPTLDALITAIEGE